MRLRRSRATQRELRDATSRGWGLDMIKKEKKKTFLKNFFFRWKFSFFKNRKSKNFEKITFFRSLFSISKNIFLSTFFSKKISNYFLKKSFWSEFFSQIRAMWFPVDWACFWVNSDLQKMSSSIFPWGGAIVLLPPPLVEISDTGL